MLLVRTWLYIAKPYSDDECDHYENGNTNIIGISSANRVRCNTHVTKLMFAVTNTSYLKIEIASDKKL